VRFAKKADISSIANTSMNADLQILLDDMGKKDK
jgi:hypothetical protein